MPLLFKVRLVLGVVLFVAGVIYDLVRFAPRVSGAFRSDPLPFLNSWEYHAQSELRLGLILLGLLNMTIALLSLHAAFSAAWPPFFLMAAGCVMYITALARSLNAGPLRGWTLRRIAWTVGLLTILLSVCLDLLRCLLAASVP